jgi:hypothetical protein
MRGEKGGTESEELQARPMATEVDKAAVQTKTYEGCSIARGRQDNQNTYEG